MRPSKAAFSRLLFFTEANGHAERTAALVMIEKRADRPNRITLGADKGYDAEDFVNELRSMNVTPHVAQNTAGRRSGVDRRTTRHPGYAVSQRIRKRIEEGFGWSKEFEDSCRRASRPRTRDARRHEPSNSLLQPKPSISIRLRMRWLTA